MQAFLFGAGFGVRLKPLTDFRPKVLVPVLGKPVIEHTIEKLALSGVSSFIINTHYQSEKLVSKLGDGVRWGTNIIYSHEPDILETGGGLKHAERLVESDTLIVYNGDIICSIDINDVINFHRERKALATLVCASWCDPKQITIDHSGKISDIRNTYLPVPPTHTFLGIHIVERSFFRYLEPDKKFSIIKTYLDLIADKQPIYAYTMQNGYWYDIGSVEQYKKVHSEMIGLQEEKSLIKPESSHIVNPITTEGFVCLGENCFVGTGCKLRNVIAWDGVHIEPNSELDDVILTDGIHVEGYHANAIV
ncbi:MAG: NDP-sugar synthase [Candidatus Auribacterota bacterium]|jgi:NDP-sugar pyrophosphorylase family protein|nr:NDP-sugar synthase [Candidatus Auribacterota bacterium]